MDSCKGVFLRDLKSQSVVDALDFVGLKRREGVDIITANFCVNIEICTALRYA